MINHCLHQNCMWCHILNLNSLRCVGCLTVLKENIVVAPKIQKPSLFALLKCKIPTGKELEPVPNIEGISLVSQTTELTLVSASVRNIALPGENNVTFVDTPVLELVAYANEKNKTTITTFWVKDQMPSVRYQEVNRLYTVKDNERRDIIVVQKTPVAQESETEKNGPTVRRKISQTSCGDIAKAKQMLITKDQTGMFVCNLVGRGGKLTLVTDCHGEAIRNKTERELVRRVRVVNPKISLAPQI